MSNSQILLVMILHVAFFLTFLYVLGRFFGDRFDTQHPLGISEGARRMIFGGVPTLCLAAFMFKGETVAQLKCDKGVRRVPAEVPANTVFNLLKSVTGSYYRVTLDSKRNCFIVKASATI
jgi:hypothetical protein